MKQFCGGLSNLKGVTDVCELCKEAKGKSISIKFIKNVRSKRSLNIIHMVLCCPVSLTYNHGHIYFLMLIDDYRRKVFACPLKSKSDVFDILKRFKSERKDF